jgi:hypothetical protein
MYVSVFNEFLSKVRFNIKIYDDWIFGLFIQAGCVHIPSSTSKLEDCRLRPEMRTMLLLYSRGKQSIIGFVPNNQTSFVKRLLEVVPDHEAKRSHRSETVSSDPLSSEVARTSEMLIIEGQQHRGSLALEGDQADLDSMDTSGNVEPDVAATIVSCNFWNYEIPREFKPNLPLVTTPDKEFWPSPQNKKTAKFLKGVKWLESCC